MNMTIESIERRFWSVLYLVNSGNVRVNAGDFA